MAPDEIRLRDAEAGDLESIAKLENECFPNPWPMRFFASELTQKGRLSRVAMIEQDLAGYAFSMIVIDEMHINKIGVEPRYRRLGIGTLLIRDALEHGARAGVTVTSLELRQSNAGARMFYEGLGFRHEFTRTRYYPNGESALIMVRRSPVA